MNRTAFRKILGLSFTLILLITIMSSAIINAAADTTPPELRSITTSKSSYSNGEQVEFILKFFDSSGIDISKLEMILNLTDSDNKYGTRVVLMEFLSTDVTSQYYSSAEKLQGYEAYSCKVPVDPNFATGEYYIPQISISDKAQNQNFYHLIETTNRITFNVVNNNRPDSIGPVLTSVSADKTTVSVGESIRFTVKAQDSNGLSGGNMKIIREGQQQWLNYELTVKAGTTDTLEHIFPPSTDTIPGVYTVQSLSVYDNAAYRNGRYFSTITDPDYFDAHALLAENFRFSFTVVNPDYAQKQDPRVTQVRFSNAAILPGDTVDIEVTVNDGGTPLEDNLFLRINRVFEGNNTIQLGGATLYRDNAGIYKGTYRVPAVFQQRNLSVGYMIYHKDGHSTQYSALDDKTYTAPVLTIGSVFNGVDDTSVLIGDTFDPMSGVTAANVSEGSLSSKINLEGEVDKQIAGVYLLKYTIPSNLPYKAHQEENPNGVYFASRIVGVTETEPSGYGTSEEEPLVIAEDSVIISADPEDITIEKDGAPVAFTDELTEEGIYEITDVSGELEPEAGLWYGYNNAGSVTFLSAHKSSSAVMFLSSAMSVSRKQSNIVLIDRSAPVISQITSKTSSAALSIQIKVKDLSPVAKIQYLAGTHDRDAVSKSGTVIRNDHKLSVSAGDTISVLATDTLGHIAFKVMTINQPSEIVNSEDPDISADPEGSVDISSYGSSLTYGGSSDEQSGTGQSGDSSNVSSSTEDPAAGNGSTLTVILIVVAVVVTGGAGAGIYFYKRKKK
ncbi:MAG: hypothetical protein PHN99_06835 [Eubacteriales bacterium]|nr:hypothetical protein [Eubacteriales bacterium]